MDILKFLSEIRIGKFLSTIGKKDRNFFHIATKGGIKTAPGGPPEFDREAWLIEKFRIGLDFPNLPYFIDGDVKVTESKSIMKYIAKKW